MLNKIANPSNKLIYDSSIEIGYKEYNANILGQQYKLLNIYKYMIDYILIKI